MKKIISVIIALGLGVILTINGIKFKKGKR